ncbi:MAG TPA: LOG family protein [Isosphaeraceae bacterium]|nr:LOG family protein [Isosphaeraceae bacterium]
MKVRVKRGLVPAGRPGRRAVNPIALTAKQSRSFVLPAMDTEFLLRDELRAVRFGLEYEKAELILREARIRSTIVVFGSARVVSRQEAKAKLKAAKGRRQLDLAKLRLQQSALYEEARRFGRIASERGGALNHQRGHRDNVIATGGGPGIMEAACRGAAEAGAPAIGFNISLPKEQLPNRYTSPGLTFQFHYFAMRKMHLVMRANALAVFPGGFGTLDELFEILTLLQTGKAQAIPVLLFDRRYWQKVVNLEAMRREGMIGGADIKLFEYADDAEEGWRSLVRRGLSLPDAG